MFGLLTISDSIQIMNSPDGEYEMKLVLVRPQPTTVLIFFDDPYRPAKYRIAYLSSSRFDDSYPHERIEPGNRLVQQKEAPVICTCERGRHPHAPLYVAMWPSLAAPNGARPLTNVAEPGARR